VKIYKYWGKSGGFHVPDYERCICLELGSRRVKSAISDPSSGEESFRSHGERYRKIKENVKEILYAFFSLKKA